MPKLVDQYRLNAVKCFELSQTFKDPDARRTLFAMANAWRTLAAQRVKNIEMLALGPRDPDGLSEATMRQHSARRCS